MRYLIYGAGGVGGVIGARLFQHGHEVVLIGRGEHLAAIQREGLRLQTPEGTEQLRLAAVGHPSELTFRDDDVVLLTVKTQDSVAALDDLRRAGGDALPVICAQNGVENERLAARRFRRVYGMSVWLPATLLGAGVGVELRDAGERGAGRGPLPGGSGRDGGGADGGAERERLQLAGGAAGHALEVREVAVESADGDHGAVWGGEQVAGAAGRAAGGGDRLLRGGGDRLRVGGGGGAALAGVRL